MVTRAVSNLESIADFLLNDSALRCSLALAVNLRQSDCGHSRDAHIVSTPIALGGESEASSPYQ